MRDSVAKVMLIGILLLIWTVPLALILGFTLWWRPGMGIRTECDRIAHAIGFSCAIERYQTPRPGVKRYSHLTLRNTLTGSPVCVIENALSTRKSNKPHIDASGVSLSEEAWLRLWEICEEWLLGKRDFAAETFTLTASEIQVVPKLDEARPNPQPLVLCSSLQTEFSSPSRQRAIKCRIVCSAEDQRQPPLPDLRPSDGPLQSTLSMVWQSTCKDGQFYLTKQVRVEEPGIPLVVLKPLWNGLHEIPSSVRWAGTIEATVSHSCESLSCWFRDHSGKLLWSREEATQSSPSLFDCLDAEGSVLLNRVVFINGTLKSADITVHAGPGQIKRAFLTFLHDSFHTSVQAYEGNQSSMMQRGDPSWPLGSLHPGKPLPFEVPSDLALMQANQQGAHPFRETDQLAGILQGDDVPFQHLVLRFDCDETGVRLMPADGGKLSWVLLESGAGWGVTVSEETLGKRVRWSQILNNLTPPQQEPWPDHRWQQAFVQFLLRCVSVDSVLGGPKNGTDASASVGVLPTLAPSHTDRGM